MQKNPRKTSKMLIAVVLIAVVVIAAVVAYAALTYPRAVLNFPVSFTIGADVEHKEFNMPFLNNQVQIQVVVNSGTALWAARIESNDTTLWSHSAAQGGQTTYNSGWIALASGNYNFTFSTIGLGTLEADVTVSSKGGFW